MNPLFSLIAVLVLKSMLNVVKIVLNVSLIDKEWEILQKLTHKKMDWDVYNMNQVMTKLVHAICEQLILHIHAVWTVSLLFAA